MATTTGSTTTSTLSSLIRTERLNELIKDPNVAPSIHGAVAWIEDGTGASTYKFNQLDEPTMSFSEASGKTEDDTAGFGNADATNSSAATVTPVVVGVKKRLSYEGSSDSGLTIDDEIRNALIGLRKRITLDLLLNAKAHSNQSDFSGLPLTIDRIGLGQSAFGAQDPAMSEGGLALILHNDGWRDFSQDMRNKNASLEATGRNRDLLKTLPGFKGYYEDMAVFVTGNVAAADGSNWSNAIVTIGRGGALGLAAWEHRPRRPNASYHYMNGILVELDGDADTQADIIIVSARYGTTVTSAADARELISMT